MLIANVPPLLFLGPAAGAVIVYLCLRIQVRSKPDGQAAASHALWVGIIGWMASSLQGATNAGILRANPTGSVAISTADQLATALAWPILATLAVHALGQLSYPTPKAPHRYAELTVRRIRDFLPRKLAWTTAGIFACAALVVAGIASLPGSSPVQPTPSPASSPDYNFSGGQGQDGRIPGSELALWLGGALLALGIGTWLVLVLIARRRQLETLDGDDNRTLRIIAVNRLLRTVATIAAGLAGLAGNFAVLPAAGSPWQSSWFSAAGLVNVMVLLVMWWWRVPTLPSLIKEGKAPSAAALRNDPRTHGAAKLSISIGAALGVAGGLALLAGVVIILTASRPLNAWAFPGLTAMAAVVLLATIAAGELLIARNYGDAGAPKQWPHRPVSNGLLAFAIVSALLLLLAVAFAVAAEARTAAPKTWSGVLLLSAVVAITGGLAALAVRRRRGIPEEEPRAGMDGALRAISMYRIVRTVAAYCLGQAAALLLITGDAWFMVLSPDGGASPIAPSPVTVTGVVLAAVAVIVAVVPVRSLLRAIPTGPEANQNQPTP